MNDQSPLRSEAKAGIARNAPENDSPRLFHSGHAEVFEKSFLASVTLDFHDCHCAFSRFDTKGSNSVSNKKTEISESYLLTRFDGPDSDEFPCSDTNLVVSHSLKNNPFPLQSTSKQAALDGLKWQGRVSNWT